MLNDFIIGSSISVAVMISHLFSTVFIRQALTAISKRMANDSLLFLVISLIIFYILSFITLCVSVAIWGASYYYLGFTGTFTESFYTAMINYTTLGLGDLNPAIKTSIYGPMAAASGILMFSWAAALLVYVVQMHIPALTLHHSKKKDQ